MSGIKNDPKGDVFFATSALGVTPTIFKKLFIVWKNRISKSNFTNLSPQLMIQVRKYNFQTFLLRYQESNEFKKMYVSIGASGNKTEKYTWTSSNKKSQVVFSNKKELFERAVDDTFKKHQPDVVDAEKQITGERKINTDQFIFSLEFEPRDDSDFTDDMKKHLKFIKDIDKEKLKSKKATLKRHQKQSKKKEADELKKKEKSKKDEKEKEASQKTSIQQRRMNSHAQRNYFTPNYMSNYQMQGPGSMYRQTGMYGGANENPRTNNGNNNSKTKKNTDPPKNPNTKDEDQNYVNALKLSIKEQEEIMKTKNKQEVDFSESNIHSVFSDFFNPRL